MKVNAFLSLFISVPTSLVVFFVFHKIDEHAFLISILFGFLTFVSMFLFLTVYKKIMDKRYSKFEKEITSPILYKTNGNFKFGNGKVKNGNIYVCEERIICAFLEEKPYTVDEIPLSSIERFQCDGFHLNIITNDDRLFVILTPDAENIINILKEKDLI